MTSPERTSDETVRMLATVGIKVTDEGKARARRKLAAADAAKTPEGSAAARARYARHTTA
jgi:hypothetical protein